MVEVRKGLVGQSSSEFLKNVPIWRGLSRNCCKLNGSGCFSDSSPPVCDFGLGSWQTFPRRILLNDWIVSTSLSTQKLLSASEELNIESINWFCSFSFESQSKSNSMFLDQLISCFIDDHSHIGWKCTDVKGRRIKRFIIKKVHVGILKRCPVQIVRCEQVGLWLDYQISFAVVTSRYLYPGEASSQTRYRQRNRRDLDEVIALSSWHNRWRRKTMKYKFEYEIASWSSNWNQRRWVFRKAIELSSIISSLAQRWWTIQPCQESKRIHSSPLLCMRAWAFEYVTRGWEQNRQQDSEPFIDISSFFFSSPNFKHLLTISKERS